MALIKKNQNQNLDLLILKICTKDSNSKKTTPFFQALAKSPEGKWETKDTFSAVRGTLYRVDRKVGEYEGQPVLSALLFLKDGNEGYLLELRYNMLTRSIINSIINIDDFSQEVEIQLFDNTKGYPSASVTNGGEKVSWKYDLNSQPKAKSVTFKGKEMRDFTEVDNFFDNEVLELSNKLKASSAKSHSPIDGKPESGDSTESDDVF